LWYFKERERQEERRIELNFLDMEVHFHKKERSAKNGIMAGMVALLLNGGCDTRMSFEERETRYGKETSVITESYASKPRNPGSTWKVLPQSFSSGVKFSCQVIYPF
jgi:hypothetical protein